MNLLDFVPEPMSSFESICITLGQNPATIKDEETWSIIPSANAPKGLEESLIDDE